MKKKKKETMLDKSNVALLLSVSKPSDKGLRTIRQHLDVGEHNRYTAAVEAMAQGCGAVILAHFERAEHQVVRDQLIERLTALVSSNVGIGLQAAPEEEERKDG